MYTDDYVFNYINIYNHIYTHLYSYSFICVCTYVPSKIQTTYDTDVYQDNQEKYTVYQNQYKITKKKNVYLCTFKTILRHQQK